MIHLQLVCIHLHTQAGNDPSWLLYFPTPQVGVDPKWGTCIQTGLGNCHKYGYIWPHTPSDAEWENIITQSPHNQAITDFASFPQFTEKGTMDSGREIPHCVLSSKEHTGAWHQRTISCWANRSYGQEVIVIPTRNSCHIRVGIMGTTLSHDFRLLWLQIWGGTIDNNEPQPLAQSGLPLPLPNCIYFHTHFLIICNPALFSRDLEVYLWGGEHLYSKLYGGQKVICNPMLVS